MRIAYFTHSLASCWNHGNAHFLRGVLRELSLAGYDVQAFEPEDSWSRKNLVEERGPNEAEAWRKYYPELRTKRISTGFDLDAALDNVDVVIVHEWNDPALVSRVGSIRRKGATFTLLFHDTHHRAVSDSQAIRRFDLGAYDGVLAFGEALAEVYRAWGWGDRVFVWHEGADTRLFTPPAIEQERKGLVWIGNWGDDERTAEIETFLLKPAQAAGLSLDVHGVRYPKEALSLLKRYGARYRGWIPNTEVPEVFSHYLATVHVPRKFYVDRLPGIPTIRVFEALACGIPLVCSPWDDEEHLFTPGIDFLVARNESEMAAHLRMLEHDEAFRQSLVLNGLAAIKSRHSCMQRMHELLTIFSRLNVTALETA